MAIHNRAGQPAQQSDLINVAQLTAQYYVLKPEAGNASRLALTISDTVRFRVHTLAA